MATTSLRRDAQRNRELLIAAAQEAFRAHGAGASMDDIARSAGVGSGTLYRHFPTRQDLLEAVTADWIEALRADASELVGRGDTRESLLEWLRRLLAHVTIYKGLAAALMTSMDDPESPLHSHCEVMDAAMQRLLDAAQSAGEVRGDVSAQELGRLVHAIALASEHDGAQNSDRMLELAMDGLRSR